MSEREGEAAEEQPQQPTHDPEMDDGDEGNTPPDSEGEAKDDRPVARPL